VPRVFFLKPDGSVDRSLDSGHPRYPFFYTPGKASLLADNMRAAAQAAGGPAAAAPPQPAAPAAVAAAGAAAQPIAQVPVAAAPQTDPPAATAGGMGEDYGLLVLIALLVVIGLVVSRLGRKQNEA